MRRQFNLLIVMPLCWLTYRAWGRRLISTDACRSLVTLWLRVGLFGHREPLCGHQRPVERRK